MYTRSSGKFIGFKHSKPGEIIFKNVLKRGKFFSKRLYTW